MVTTNNKKQKRKALELIFSEIERTTINRNKNAIRDSINEILEQAIFTLIFETKDDFKVIDLRQELIGLFQLKGIIKEL